MSGYDFEPEFSPSTRYAPSGRFDAMTLVPLLGLGMAVALVMAFVLVLAEDNFYYYFITPAFVGAPVFGAIWGVVYLGHCRNAALGTAIGLVLSALYYVGFWEISYYSHVVSRGPGAVAMVRFIGGAPGLPGYFLFRCKTSKPIAHHGAPPAQMRGPNAVDRVFNYVLFGGEALLVLGLGTVVGRNVARRAYYERARRWSSKLEFRLPPSTLPTVLNAVDAHDWAAIAALPRVASVTNANAPSVLFRVEYLPGLDDEPAYLSVSGSNLPRTIPLLDAEGVPRKPLRGGVYFKQVTIEPDSAKDLARHLPGFKSAPAPTKAADREEAMGLAPAASFGDGLESPSKKPGWFQKKVSGPDFRERAVAASVERLDEREQLEPWLVDESCCLPAGEGGRREHRSVAWWKIKIQILSMVAFFAALGLAAWAEGMKDNLGRRPPIATALTATGAIGAVGVGIFMLGSIFGADAIQKRFLARRLRRRPGSLLQAADGLRTRLLRLEDAQSFHIQKLAPEDVCVCAFDAPNRRLLIEGVSYRYIVRDVDVTSFWPLQSGPTVSVRLEYRIGDEPLALVLAADNPLFHVFHGAFAHRTLKTLARQFISAFGREFPDTDRPAVKTADG